MKPAKICIECKVAPVPPTEAKKPKSRCPDCHREFKKLEMARLRKARRLIVIQNASAPVDRKVCSKCLHQKRLSEFSPSKSARSGKMNSLCDSCLTYIYTGAAYATNGFCDVWWRKRAYSVNTAYRNMLARDRGVPFSSVSLVDLDYVCKPQDIAELFASQGGKCSYCLVALDPANTAVDHAEPKSKGGIHRPSNFRISCGDCNKLKHTKSEVEFRSFVIEYAKRFQVTELPDKELGG